MRLGWSQAKLARQVVDATVGVDSLEQATVSKWERGEHLPSLDWRPALRRLLGSEVARLLDAAELHALERSPTVNAEKDQGKEDETKRRVATAEGLVSALEVARHAEASDCGSGILESLDRAIDRFARDYPTASPAAPAQGAQAPAVR